MDLEDLKISFFLLIVEVIEGDKFTQAMKRKGSRKRTHWYLPIISALKRPTLAT
jgi:hypothetical protein